MSISTDVELKKVDDYIPDGTKEASTRVSAELAELQGNNTNDKA